jgi:hypothetical protein
MFRAANWGGPFGQYPVWGRPPVASNALRQSSKCRTRGGSPGCSFESRTRSQSPISARIALLWSELRLMAFRMGTYGAGWWLKALT